ncbi:hypothetical protein BD626DRAFT_404243 [Schizophyllum amplum]|uniref:Uncharacterized protein n=1 Tax=Schizophyllum amplum TaxID=97359 RepID=A0A550CBW6_9AGAR|nr:hypothetical protein BD626DRAFT_404243 [Auriculariopsis ampla]
MSYRLPTHTPSLVPPPSEQARRSTPWRGVLCVTGMRASDKDSSQDLRVSAVETDGDSSMDLWPSEFFVRVLHGHRLLRDVQAYVRRYTLPQVTFMADRLGEANAQVVNQTTFRSLSRILYENEMIAVAPWGADNRLPGAGMIIFPAENSSSLLVAALFPYSVFPDFVTMATIPMQSPSQYYPPIPPIDLAIQQSSMSAGAGYASYQAGMASSSTSQYATAPTSTGQWHAQMDEQGNSVYYPNYRGPYSR